MASTSIQADSRIRISVFGSQGPAPAGQDVLSAPCISYFFPVTTNLVTIGRGNAPPPTIVDIAVSGTTLSKAHCSINVVPGQSGDKPLSFIVSDLGSANGTTIRPIASRGAGAVFGTTKVIPNAEAQEMLSVLQLVGAEKQLGATKDLLSVSATWPISTADENEFTLKQLIVFPDAAATPTRLPPLTPTLIDHHYNVISIGKTNSIVITISDLAHPAHGWVAGQQPSGVTAVLWSDLSVLCQSIKELATTVASQHQQLVSLRASSLLVDATPNKECGRTTVTSASGIGSATPIEQSPQQNAKASTAVDSHGSSTATFMSATSNGSQQAVLSQQQAQQRKPLSPTLVTPEAPQGAARPPPLPATLIVNDDGPKPAGMAATLPDPYASGMAIAATLIVNDDILSPPTAGRGAPLPPTLQVNYDSSTDDDESHHVPPPAVAGLQGAPSPANPPLFSVNAGGRGKSDALNTLLHAVAPVVLPKSDPPTEADEDDNAVVAPRGQPIVAQASGGVLAQSSHSNVNSPAGNGAAAPPQPLLGRVPPVPASESDDDNVAPPPAVKPEQNPLLSDFFRKPTVPVAEAADDSQDDDDAATLPPPSACKSGRGAKAPVAVAPQETQKRGAPAPQPTKTAAKRGRSPAANDDDAPPPARVAPHSDTGVPQPAPTQPLTSHTPPASTPGPGVVDDGTDDDVPPPPPVTRGVVAPPGTASTTYVPTPTPAPRGAATPTVATTTYTPAVAPRGAPSPAATSAAPTTYVPGGSSVASTTYVPNKNIVSAPPSTDNSVSMPVAPPVAVPPSATATPAVAKAEWQFKTDLRKSNKNDIAWTSYSDSDSVAIEAAYIIYENCNGTVAKKKAQAAPMNATYSVNFREMVQFRNDDENRQRPIRRKP